MKILIFTVSVLISSIVHAQYSNYYNVDVNENINQNVNINKNVNVSGNVHKTITTIDYGALQMANAQREKNILEQQKFADERQRQIAIEIAEDPLKAYDYGNWLSISTKDRKNWDKAVLTQVRQNIHLKEFKMEYMAPNNILFNMLGDIYTWQNISKDGITTTIYIYLPFYNNNKDLTDVEKDFDKVIIGKEFEEANDQGKIQKLFFHKKDLNRAIVFGNQGLRATYILEDKFENRITDNYEFIDEQNGNEFRYFVKVRYNGDKDEVDFEKLEGRRYYLRPLIEKIISTGRISELEILK